MSENKTRRLRLQSAPRGGETTYSKIDGNVSVATGGVYEETATPFLTIVYAVMGIGSFWREDRAPGRPILAVLQRDGGLYLLTRTILEVAILVTFKGSASVRAWKELGPFVLSVILNFGHLKYPLYIHGIYDHDNGRPPSSFAQGSSLPQANEVR